MGSRNHRYSGKEKHFSSPQIANLKNFVISYMIEDTVEHGLPEPEFEDTGTAIVVTFKRT